MKVYSQLERAQAENLSSDPSAGVRGRIHYNTTSGLLKVDTGSAIKTISGQQEILSSDPSPGQAGRTFFNSSTSEFKGDTGTGIVTLSPAGGVPSTDEADVLRNISVVAGVAASQLTITLKTKSGADLSPASPGTIGFRSSTATSGLFNTREINTAFNVIVVPSGTTIGTRPNIDETIYVYLIDNAGTVEGAVSLTKYDEKSLVSTSAVSGGSDRFAIYSATARSNVPIRLVGQLVSNQATSGAWISPLLEQSTKHTDTVSFLTASQFDKNWFHNAAHEIWQRTTYTPGFSSSGVVADRWKCFFTGGGAADIQRSTDTPASSVSLFNSLYSHYVDVTIADAALGASDFYSVAQLVEGFDYANLKGKRCTVSFWVKATKTGTSCVSFVNGGNDRSYVAQYTINAANTWEYKEIPITFNYSGGTDNFNTSKGLEVHWTLAAGSTYQTTAGSWQNGYFIATASQVNHMDNVLNDFKLALCQLNIGDRAIPFRRCGKTFAEELAICQRYYEKTYPVDTAVGTNISSGRMQVVYFSDNRLFVNLPLKVQKRIGVTPGTNFFVYNAVTGSSESIRQYNAANNITVNYTNIDSDSDWQVSGFLNRTGGASFVVNAAYIFHFIVDADF